MARANDSLRLKKSAVGYSSQLHSTPLDNCGTRCIIKRRFANELYFIVNLINVIAITERRVCFIGFY